jgi:hypothetical protein
MTAEAEIQRMVSANLLDLMDAYRIRPSAAPHRALVDATGVLPH